MNNEPTQQRQLIQAPIGTQAGPVLWYEGATQIKARPAVVFPLVLADTGVQPDPPSKSSHAYAQRHSAAELASM